MKGWKKKLLCLITSVILSVCQAVPVMAGEGSGYAEALANDDGSVIFTVYSQEGVDGPVETARAYTLTDLDEISEHDVCYGYEYWKNSTWSLWVTTVCTPLEAILADCDLSFGDKDQIVVRAGTDGFSYTMTYDVYQNSVSFYPSVTQYDPVNMDNGIRVPCVIGICWEEASAEGNSTAGEIRDSLAEKAVYSGNLRLFLGSKEEDFYAAGSSGGREATSTVAGNRSVNGVDSITVIHDASYDYKIDFMTTEEKPYQSFYLKEGAEIPCPDTHPLVPEMVGTEEEYAFDHWYRLGENGEKIAYEAGVTVSSDQTYYPEWKKRDGSGNDDLSYDRFTDLKPSAWYRPAIEYVLKNHYFNGTGETTFEPDGSMTRAMFVTVLSRMEGIDASQYRDSAFSDVETGKWYSGAIQWASRNEIVKGVGEGKFLPDGTVTREQMAVILYNYAKFKGLDPSAADASKFNDFTDRDRVSGWAVDAMTWAASAGIIRGMGDNTLAPQKSSTRAEVAQIMKNYKEKEV